MEASSRVFIIMRVSLFPIVSPLRHWRTSLPAALLVGMIVLSCSTACITGGLIDATAAARRDALERGECARIQRMLTAGLLSSKPPISGFDRLTVTGGYHVYAIVAEGENTVQNSAALQETARQLIYSRAVPFNTRFEILAYRDGGHSRPSDVKLVVDLKDEVRVKLKGFLPPARSVTPEPNRLRVYTNNEGTILYIQAVGGFTLESGGAFMDEVRKLQPVLPAQLHILAWAFDDIHGRETVGHYDSDASGDAR